MRCTTIAMLVVALAGCSKDTDPEGLARPEPSTVAEPEPEPSPLDVILDATDFQAALEVARPLLADAVDEPSLGAVLLGIWAAKHMTWTDVAVTRDETTIRTVLKDASTERGKRMCIRGRLVQIHRDRSIDEPLWIGLLADRRRDMVHFIGAGSTGDLVQGSRTRFCGAVTGTYSYANTGGGTTHAVELVGMFDLSRGR
jgi:hypothetical protein